MIVLAVSFICSVLATLFVCFVLAVSFICSVLVGSLLAVLAVTCVAVCSVGYVSVDVFVVHAIVCLFATVGVLFVDTRSHLRAGDADYAGDCKQYNERESDSDECLCHCVSLSSPYSRLVDMGVGVNTASRMP